MGEGSAFEAREFVKLGRCARRAVPCVGRAGTRIEEHALATAVGGAVRAGPVHIGPFPVGIALVSGVSHSLSSFFLRLKAGCRSNRVCLSGEERDGEGGGKSMAWRGQAALARPTPLRASGAALGGPHGAVYFPSGTKGQQPLVFPALAGLRGRAVAL